MPKRWINTLTVFAPQKCDISFRCSSAYRVRFSGLISSKEFAIRAGFFLPIRSPRQPVIGATRPEPLKETISTLSTACADRPRFSKVTPMVKRPAKCVLG
jgi:hypothetical protein